eukprot:m.542371 g.542371  ORF g.542371 m.542371 type:complete len:653 (+) comp22119_c0_seq1:545-2503(+)
MVPVSPFRTRGSNVPRARCKSALVIGVVFCVLVLVEIARDRCMTGNERNYASNGTQKHTQMLTSHYPTVPVAPNRTTETATQATTQVEEKRLHGLQGATMSLQALQQKRWSLDSGFGGDVSDTCADVDSAAIASGETVLQKLCQMEMEEILPHASGQPKTLLVDTAFINHKSTKYYLNRDGDAWKLTYGNAGFKVNTNTKAVEPSVHSFDVLQCLGLKKRHLCISPGNVHKLHPHQRVSFISGMRDILWRKDEFCRTTAQVLAQYTGAMKYIIPCFVLPQSRDAFVQTYFSHPEDNGTVFMVKPIDRGEGHGLYVASNLAEIEQGINEYISTAERIVQPYMEHPLLIHGKKFDIRAYVLVTSISPLRVYLYDEGLVRFAATNYSKNATKTGAKDQYLTNTSVGKLHALLKDLVWSFKRLWEYFDANGQSSRQILDRIHAAIVSVLMMSEARFHEHFQQHLHGGDCTNCFQLLGVDVILDAALQPKIIEVNGLPSMQLSQNQGDAMDMADPYTMQKLHIAHDVVALLFRPHSSAGTLAAHLDTARIGLRPGAACRGSDFTDCIGKDDLRKLLRMYRESQTTGDFARIYPPVADRPMDRRIQDELQRLAAHMHGMVRNATDPSAVTPTTTFSMQPIVDKLAAVASLGAAVGASE